ncbi:zinc finger protein 723-like isoform X1 [Euwallacea fornicatus]|uniref:zinc finger protein 723-like isoform X1 n=1 Tax=Euwallacea fornicatus TaxID=995702 RepID=UPI00338EA049
MPLSLKCPLCCNETFPTHDSLMKHLEELIHTLSNLTCPSCDTYCVDLGDLVNHLEGKCEKITEPPLEGDYIVQNVSLIGAPNNQFNHVVESSDLVMIEEVTEIPREIHIQAEESGSKSHDQNMHVEDITDNPDMIYTCDTCNVSFISIKEHLAKFHEGEDVVLETEDPEEVEIDKNNDPMSISDDQSDADETADEGDVPELENHDASEEVQELRPITSKYILEQGQRTRKVRSVTDEEAAEIEDKSRIIYIHKCPECDLQFPSIQHFEKHQCSLADRKKVKRSKKNKLTLRKQDSDKVIKSRKIEEDFMYKCTFCHDVHPTLKAVNDHMKTHLTKNEQGEMQAVKITLSLNNCEICNTSFPSYKQAKLHARMHAPIKPKKMEFPVTNDEQLVVGTESEENSNIECPVCHKTYNKRFEEVHMKSHNEKEQFICTLCNRKFDSDSSLKLHLKVHSNVTKFICSYCKKPFKSPESLDLHKKNQCQIRDYECQHCGRKFKKAHEKVKHERIHTGEKPYVCEICGKAFRISYCLTLHMRIHTGKRPHLCNICSKSFKSYSVFHHHLKTHSDERNYKCPFCPKAFKTAVQLAGHKNSHIKPFACTKCNRPFASLYAVRAHMETHERKNNLQYDCPICNASYARMFALRDHIREAHVHKSIGGDIAEKTEAEKILRELEKTTYTNHKGTKGDASEEVFNVQMVEETGNEEYVVTD